MSYDILTPSNQTYYVPNEIVIEWFIPGMGNNPLSATDGKYGCKVRVLGTDIKGLGASKTGWLEALIAAENDAKSRGWTPSEAVALVDSNRKKKATDPSTAMMDVLRAVVEERARQDTKWGVQNHDDYRFLAIAGEELGEVAQAVLETEFGGPHANFVREELVQLAAVCVSWLEAISRRKK